MANRIAQNVSQLGWLNASLYLLGRLLTFMSRDQWAIYKYHFVAQAISVTNLSRGRGKKIHVRRHLVLDELPQNYPRPFGVLRQRYDQGALSLAAYSNDQLAGCLWLSFGSYQEDEVRARYTLTKSHAWDFDVWVRPEMRLGFIFSRLWDEANSLLEARSVRWSCSRISAFNDASIRAHARIGMARLGSATFMRCGHWQWMCSTLPPYFHISRHPASFPEFHFDTRSLDPAPSLEDSCSISKK